MAMGRAYSASLVLLLPSLLLWKPSLAAADHFVSGETFSAQRTITSSSGDFVFGFFNLSDDGSTSPRWYVGIWYAKAASLTVAWVANREDPISTNQLSFTFLSITNESSLQLITNGSIVWSTKCFSKRATAAVIQNDGNLVLVASENRSEALWQSFDEPGDTWLPGMKLGTNQTMYGWKSLWNPSKGPFCQYMNSAGSFYLSWNRSISYWNGGVWDGQKYTNVPQEKQNVLFRYRLVDLGSYKYFIYWYADNPPVHPLARTWLNPNGQLQALSLQNSGQWSLFWAAPGNPCDVYATCGAFASCNSNNAGTCTCLAGYRPRHPRAWDAHDWYGGCMRNTPFACDSSARARVSGDGFVNLASHSLPSAGVVQKGLLSPQACRHKCLANCSCTAFSSNESCCIHWFGDLLNLRSDATGIHQDVSLYLRLNSRDIPGSPNNRGKGTKVRLYAGVGVAGLSLMAVAVISDFRRRQTKKRSPSGCSSVSLKVFSYKELRAATRNFSKCIGGGAFGLVFKGALADAAQTEVAVKKLESSMQGEKEFRNEVATIGQVQHINVLQLLGFCTERHHRMLVYEFMPNGSLASRLFGAGHGLDWKTRFAVAVDAARALEYLHDRCRERIIHCDIKPENILLDAQFRAKIADFGLAKMLGRDFSRVLTSMRGTRGYLAPEWLSGQPITDKADVYSFGRTLLEIVTGRRVYGSGDQQSLFYPAWAAAAINAGNEMAVVDARLANEAGMEEEVRRAACMALWCVQDEEGARPAMRDVVKTLVGLAQPPELRPPVPASIHAAADTSTTTHHSATSNLTRL